MTLKYIIASKFYKRNCLYIFILILFFVIIALFYPRKDTLAYSHSAIYSNIVQKVISKFNKCLHDKHVYCVINDLWVCDHRNTTLILTTHCSINHLNDLHTLLETWTGRVSAAIFVADSEVNMAIDLLHQYIHCYPSNARRLCINLVIELHRTTRLTSETWKTPQLYCSSSTIVPPGVNRVNYADVIYPNNLLRNVAISAAPAVFVLALDIDILPSPDAYDLITRFLLSNHGNDTRQSSTDANQLVAYVLPVFEKRNQTPMPLNKHDLILFNKLNNVRTNNIIIMLLPT